MACDSTQNPIDYANRLAWDDFPTYSTPWYGFDAAPTGGFKPGVNEIVRVGFGTDRDLVLDTARVFIDGVPTPAQWLRVIYVSEGQTPAAALSAGQLLTTTYDMATGTNKTYNSLTVLHSPNAVAAGVTPRNIIPAKSFLALVFGDGSGAVAGSGSGDGGGGDGTIFHVHFRLRSKQL